MGIYKKSFLVTLLSGVSAIANAGGLGGYVGIGLGAPDVEYGSSSAAYQLFGGLKVHEFQLPSAGSIELAIEGEYVNFGNSSVYYGSWKNSGYGVAAVGSWVLPKEWIPWADEKLVVIAKAGGARISTKFGGSNSYIYGGDNFTYTGLSEGVGAEYRFSSMLAARAMANYYPNGYDVLGIQGIFMF